MINEYLAFVHLVEQSSMAQCPMSQAQIAFASPLFICVSYTLIDSSLGANIQRLQPLLANCTLHMKLGRYYMRVFLPHEQYVEIIVTSDYSYVSKNVKLEWQIHLITLLNMLETLSNLCSNITVLLKKKKMEEHLGIEDSDRHSFLRE